MDQTYTRKSTITSVTNAEKIIAENIKTVANNKKRFRKFMERLRKNWDKYVYTFCILINYLNYVSSQN